MILISGEALIDLIPDPIKSGAYDAVLGGSPYNVAIGLSRLGASTGFISRLSADGNGEALAASLAENGVNIGYVARELAPDDARLRYAQHRQNRIALFVLPRRDGLRRPLAVSDRLAKRRSSPARRFGCRRRRPPCEIGSHGADCRAPAGDNQLRSEHPPSRDPGSRFRGVPGGTRNFAGPSRQGQRGRPRVALSRPRY